VKREQEPQGEAMAITDDDLETFLKDGLYEAFARRVPQVTQAYHEHQDAKEGRERVAGQIIRGVLKIIRPAREALVSKVEHTAEWVTGGQPGAAGQVTTWHDLEGLLLVDQYKVFHDESKTKGRYGGTALYLMDDGKLYVGRRWGVWSKGTGEKSVRYTEVEKIGCRAAANRFGISEILTGLNEALKKQMGRLPQTPHILTSTMRLEQVLADVKHALYRSGEK
jgi:hypothetical protein